MEWTQARFSICLPPPQGPVDTHRVATKAVTNGLGPLLAGVGCGVGVLQIVNGSSSLSLGSAPSGEGGISTSVVLSLRAGQVVLGSEQDIWLSLDGENAELKGLNVHRRGSHRFDFFFTWSGSDHITGGGDSSASSSDRVNFIHKDDTTTLTNDGQSLGPAGGHVVGELRPLNEFSAMRQEALDKALGDMGVDVRELTEADEFFGTAALKSYNTFVRPRPKQLAKVMQEPVGRAAERTAHSVAFLVRRHRADRAEYLRNKDAALSEVQRRGLKPHPVVLVCDNVRSAYNIGSIFRSADTARAAEVITCGLTPHPGGHGEDKVRKTGFGSIDAVRHRHFQDPAEAVLALRAEGRQVWALETTEGAVSLFDVQFPLPAPIGALSHLTNDKGGMIAETRSVETEAVSTGSDARAFDSGEKGGGVALVLGNEVTGVDERVLSLCDRVVEVPVYGLKNSLNVASACTVVLYEVLRQWYAAGRLMGGGGCEN
ncbi:unnamed protein product [Choristocarpus tenellus]